MEPREQGDGERTALGLEATSRPPCSLLCEAAWEFHHLQV